MSKFIANMSLKTFLLVLVVVAGILHPSNGSHFRGGMLTWKPVANSSYQVILSYMEKSRN